MLLMHGLSYGPALTRNTKERASVCQSDQVGLRPPRVISYPILTRTILNVVVVVVVVVFVVVVFVFVVVVVVFTLKAVPVSTQYFLTSVLVQLTRTPSVVTG